jgi:hypothetical protein
LADVAVFVDHLHLNGRIHHAERPSARAEIERDDVRADAVAVLRAHAAGEHVLGDVDLMLYPIDVSPRSHASDPCITGASRGSAACTTGARVMTRIE